MRGTPKTQTKATKPATKAAKPRVPKVKPAKLVAKPKNKFHHGSLPAALKSAALQLLQEGGAQAVSLREATRRVGVTHTATYRHFDSREALLAAVAGDGFEAMAGELSARSVGAGNGLLRLAAVGLGYVEFARKNPALFRLMFGPELQPQRRHPSANAPARAAAELLRSLVVDGQAEGVIQPSDPTAVALTSWALAHGLAVLILDGQIPERSDVVQFAADTLYNALSTTVGTTPVH